MPQNGTPAASLPAYARVRPHARRRARVPPDAPACQDGRPNWDPLPQFAVNFGNPLRNGNRSLVQ